MKTTTMLALIIGCVFVTASHAEDETNKLAKVYCSEGFTRFKKGVDIFEGGSNNQFISIPKELEKFKICIHSHPAPEALEFKVKSPGLVRLVVTHQYRAGMGNDGWKVIGKATLMADLNDEYGGRHEVSLYVIEKHLDKGEYSFPKKEWVGVRILKK